MRVTDHAILRFAEYALGLDTKTIGKQILSMVTPKTALYDLGTHDLRARVIDGTVVTVIKPPRQYRKKRAKVKKPHLVEVETDRFVPEPLWPRLGDDQP